MRCLLRLEVQTCPGSVDHGSWTGSLAVCGCVCNKLYLKYRVAYKKINVVYAERFLWVLIFYRSLIMEL